MDALFVMFCAIPASCIALAAVVHFVFNGRLPGMWRR